MIQKRFFISSPILLFCSRKNFLVLRVKDNQLNVNVVRSFIMEIFLLSFYLRLLHQTLTNKMACINHSLRASRRRRACRCEILQFLKQGIESQYIIYIYLFRSNWIKIFHFVSGSVSVYIPSEIMAFSNFWFGLINISIHKFLFFYFGRTFYQKIKDEVNNVDGFCFNLSWKNHFFYKNDLRYAFFQRKK